MATGTTFDRSAVAKALDRLSLNQLTAALEEKELSDVDLAALFGLMERCSALFFRQSNPPRQARRDAFVEALERYLGDRVGSSGSERAAAFRELVGQVEAGYRDVAHGLRTAAISALPKQRQLVAILQRAGHEGDDYRAQAIAAARRTTNFDDPVIGHDADGRPFDIDGSLAAYVLNLGACLKLLAGRFDSDAPPGALRLPVPVEASDEEIFKAGTSLISSSAFRRWRRIEERRRFWGGNLCEYTPPNLPEGVAPTIEVIREFRPRVVAEVLDWVANERMKDLLRRQIESARFEIQDPRGFAGVDEPAALAPERFVSLKEQGAYMALSGLVSSEPFLEQQRFRGLTLAEWLRGYATLNILANAAYERDPAAACQSLLIMEPKEVETRLCTVGMSEAASADFVRYATLGDHSDDMFDCPLLLLEDGRRLLYAPAAVDVDLTRVVLSNLSALGEGFTTKGKSFERQVLQFFRDHGFAAFTVDTKRNGEPYQIDVIVPWEKHLFLFECKNEWLSESSPIAAYNFEKTRREHFVQVLRQVDGIEHYPDMVMEKSGIDPSSMTIVPVLLYAFPYAAPDLGKGIYVNDWSSLTRFFSSRDLNAKYPRQAGRAIKLRRRSVHRQWKGDRPVPSDLLRHLKDPPQVRMMIRKATVLPDDFWLADHRLARSYEWRRERKRASPQDAKKALVEETRRWREAEKRR